MPPTELARAAHRPAVSTSVSAKVTINVVFAPEIVLRRSLFLTKTSVAAACWTDDLTTMIMETTIRNNRGIIFETVSGAWMDIMDGKLNFEQSCLHDYDGHTSSIARHHSVNDVLCYLDHWSDKADGIK